MGSCAWGRCWGRCRRGEGVERGRRYVDIIIPDFLGPAGRVREEQREVKGKGSCRKIYMAGQGERGKGMWADELVKNRHSSTQH